MSFHVDGDYFESCTCRVSCPCVFLADGGRLVAPTGVVLILGGALLAFGWRIW
jgi:hypothetical protein